jgi:hypothetical protein
MQHDVAVTWRAVAAAAACLPRERPQRTNGLLISHGASRAYKRSATECYCCCDGNGDDDDDDGSGVDDDNSFHS